MYVIYVHVSLYIFNYSMLDGVVWFTVFMVLGRDMYTCISQGPITDGEVLYNVHFFISAYTISADQWLHDPRVTYTCIWPIWSLSRKGGGGSGKLSLKEIYSWGYRTWCRHMLLIGIYPRHHTLPWNPGIKTTYCCGKVLFQRWS